MSHACLPVPLLGLYLRWKSENQAADLIHSHGVPLSPLSLGREPGVPVKCDWSYSDRNVRFES